MKKLFRASILIGLMASAPFHLYAEGSRTDAPSGRVSENVSKTEKADSLPLYWLNEIVVTGRRAEARVEDLALSVSIIGRDEIGSANRNSSTDLAGVLPGIFIDRTGDFGRSDVSIRGLGSRGRYSLVLVDGRPEKMALFDCTVTHSFPLNDVERIEVVKGASSMLYGSGALGGVMNVIPRQVREDYELDLKASGGSHDTWVANGRIGGRKGKLTGHVSADHRESAGHVEHSAYKGSDVRAGGMIEFDHRFSLSLSGKYFDGYKEEPLRATDDLSVIADTWNEYRRGSFDLHLKGNGDIYSGSARYYRNFGEHRFSSGWYSRDATDGVMIYGRFNPLQDLFLNCGADYRYQQGRFPDEAGSGWGKWETGAYLAGEYSIASRIIVSAGARYNRDSIAGDQLSPSAGVVWRPADGSSLRALVSHGFRSPQINELYMFPSSNEDLEAERVWNYETGLRQVLPWNMTVDLTVFRSEGRGMIELRPNGSPPPLMIYANTGRFEFTGIEGSLSGRWGSGLGGTISYSWLDPGEWTTGRPGRKLDVHVSMARKKYMIETRGQLVGEYYAGNGRTLPIEPFAVIDVYAEAAIAPGLRFFGGINNILDERYAIYADLAGGAAGLYEMPGIALMAGLKYGL